jgi:hypothetical protein
VTFVLQDNKRLKSISAKIATVFYHQNVLAPNGLTDVQPARLGPGTQKSCGNCEALHIEADRGRVKLPSI